MSRLLSLLLAAFSAASLQADPIDFEAARRIAGQRLSQPVPAAQSAPLVRMKAKGTGTGTVENPAYYVFNDAGGKGFCLVAGDDRLGGVLGYSDTGRMDMGNLPPGLRSLLRGYERAALAVQVDSVDVTPAYPTPPKAFVKPLVTCKWNQYAPFNLYTPTVGGKHTPTGCVATAIAQVLYSHKWPKERPSKFPRGESDAYALDYYDWDNMIDDYESGGYNTANGTAVATLMRDCGRACKMIYTEKASFGQPWDLWYSLENTFGYSVRELEKDRLPSGVFLQAVYNELSEGNAIFMCGGNHAFVYDGYDTNGLVHTNWGWGGLEDGYFDINKAATQSSGDITDGNYYEDQVALFARPRDGKHEPFEEQPTVLWMVYNGALQIEEKEIAADGSLTAKLTGVGVRNMVKGTYGAYRGKVGIGLFSGADGKCLHVYEWPYEQRWYSLYGSYNYENGWQLSLPEAGALPDGAYYLQPVGHRRIGETGDTWEDTWKLVINGNRVYLDKAGETVTVREQVTTPQLELTEDPEVLAPFYEYAGDQWAMAFKVGNRTRYEARGNLLITFRGKGALEGETFEVPKTSIPKYIAERNDTTRWLVKFYTNYTGTAGSAAMRAGRYSVEMSMECEDGAVYPIPFPSDYEVEVLPSGYKNRVSVTWVNIYDGEKEAASLYFDPKNTESVGLAVSTFVKYLNGSSLSTRLRYRLKNLKTGQYDHTSPSISVSLPFGQSQMLPATRHEVPLSELQGGCDYEIHVEVQREGEWLDLWNSESFRRHFTVLGQGGGTPTGCRPALCDRPAAAPSVHSLQGVRLSPSTKALPKGVYIVNGRKVIRSDK